MHKKESDSPLTDAAEKMLSANGRADRNIVYNCRQFEILIGQQPVASITPESLDAYRKAAQQIGRTKNTISITIRDVKAVYRFVMSRPLTPDPLPRIPKTPKPQASELTGAAKRFEKRTGRTNYNLSIRCRNFERLVGKRPISEFTVSDLQAYQVAAAKAGLSKITIESTITSVRFIIKKTTGTVFPEWRTTRRNFPPTKLMIAAEKYIEDGGLRSRNLVYNSRLFFNLFGDIEPADIKTEHLIEYRKAGLNRNLSRVSIEKHITDVMTVCRSVTGVLLNAGRRLRRNRPAPDPAPLDSLERVFHVSPEWFQQWLVVTTWTGVRLMDSMRLQLMIQTAEIHNGEFISYQASKTGKNHIWPIPEWLRAWLTPVELPYLQVTQWGCRMPRVAITEYCLKAGVPRFTPKQLRQRCVTQWTRANGAAGAIIHGKSLGVLDSYIDQPELLMDAMPKVIMPAAFKLRAGIVEKAASESDDPFKLFQQLDDNTRAVLMQTMRAMLGTKTGKDGSHE